MDARFSAKGRGIRMPAVSQINLWRTIMKRIKNAIVVTFAWALISLLVGEGYDIFQINPAQDTVLGFAFLVATIAVAINLLVAIVNSHYRDESTTLTLDDLDAAYNQLKFIINAGSGISIQKDDVNHEITIAVNGGTDVSSKEK